MLCVTRWATGLAVPTSSTTAVLKKWPTSRQAAMPTPSSSGSLALKLTMYSLAGSKPPLTQICVGSGVPGKGSVALQLAQAQSLLGTTTSPIGVPSCSSPVRVTSLAWVVSSVEVT